MQVVVRALEILKGVSSSSSSLSLADISSLLNLPAPTVHRFLYVLVEQGFLTKDDGSRRYVAGPEVLKLVSRQTISHLPEAARPVLERLSARFDETVFVNAYADDRTVCVSVIESSRPLRLNVQVGDVLPWHAAASSRAILAFLPPGSAERLIGDQGMDRFAGNTPQTLEEVDNRLEHVRLRGYDVGEDELDSGVWAASAPVFSAEGPILGSLTLGAPGDRLRTRAARAAVISALRESATQIAAGLLPEKLRSATRNAVP